MKSIRGFTLIELLIVVAIIAILAAIAVPNFLEAQTRSKVSRVKADMRSLATAVESYFIDNNEYHPSVNPMTGNLWDVRIEGYHFLTSPISYITSAFSDVFNRKEVVPPGYRADGNRVLIWWGTDFLIESPAGTNLRSNTATTYFLATDFPDISDATTLVRDPLWAMLSFGPDADPDVTDVADGPSVQMYDPTNGTLSDGDVIRFKE